MPYKCNIMASGSMNDSFLKLDQSLMNFRHLVLVVFCLKNGHVGGGHLSLSGSCCDVGV